MIRKSYCNSADNFKRQAKKIKKERGISHHQALDLVVQDAGFTNWRNFINSDSKSVDSKIEDKSLARYIPHPSVLTYHTLGAKSGAKRPNIKMSIKSHQELGTLLKELRNATAYHKRAQNLINNVRNQLDDWIQMEYTSRQELSDEVFFTIYFGDHDSPSDRSPSEKRKKELIKMLERANAIITQSYHDCTPVSDLIKNLDLAITKIKKWPLGKSSDGSHSLKKQLASGTLVYVKSNKKPAVIIQHDIWRGTLTCYTDSGHAYITREEVTVPRDQSSISNFMPMRLQLPYGKWRCKDGTEVLFNRDYCPIWIRSIDGKVSEIDSDTQIIYEDDAEYYFSDITVPWTNNRASLTKCIAVLTEWGVENKSSHLMNLLKTAIESGNIDILTQKNRNKLFPTVSV